jgi:hypothetical protein
MDSLALDSNEEEHEEEQASTESYETRELVPAGFARKSLKVGPAGPTSTPTSIVDASIPIRELVPDRFISVSLKDRPIGPAFASRSKRLRDYLTH